jgi:hypothetical protein
MCVARKFITFDFDSLELLRGFFVEAGRPTEAAAAADASKVYVTAVMRLGHGTVCSCDDGRKYFRPASITCFKSRRSKRSPLNFDLKF